MYSVMLVSKVLPKEENWVKNEDINRLPERKRNEKWKTSPQSLISTITTGR